MSFQPRYNYWLSRGYSILVPDHRGSTGHGRGFTTALRGQWGDLDARDVVDLLASVQRSHGFTASTTAVIGASAGGLTALGVAASAPDKVAACVAVYPVADIAALDDATHRFEAHYNRSLVGSPSETIERSLRRSPIHRVTEIARVPVLLMHGDLDPVVPVDQSRRLADALRRAGGEVEYIEFAGEGHGFRGVDAKRDEFHATERFLSGHLTG